MGVERLLNYLDEMFALHLSPTEINKRTLTRSSRRRLCRHRRHLLLCRRLPLRLAPVGGEHRQLPSDQRLCVQVFWSYSAHAQWYASYPLATVSVSAPRRPVSVSTHSARPWILPCSPEPPRVICLVTEGEPRQHAETHQYTADSR